MSKSIKEMTSVELLGMLMRTHSDPEVQDELIRRGLIYEDHKPTVIYDSALHQG